MATTTQSRSGLDWEGTALPEAPTAPETLQESGLSLPFLNDLLLRTLYTRGALLGLDLARHLCLPFKVIEEALTFLKTEKCVEVAGGDLIGKVSYRFNLTELGRKRAQDAMTLCGYVGPAPVPLEDYVEQAYRQAVTGINCAPDALRASLSHLVVRDELFNAIGPAIVSGRSVFIYGPPGNGKTSIANAVGDFMTSAAGGRRTPCNSVPTSAPARCRWTTTSSRPTARRSRASPATPRRCGRRSATWSSARSCSTPSARR